MAKEKFAGFSLSMLHFLSELSRNNNRKWFQANKLRYEQEVRKPALEFIEAMQLPLAKLSPHFRAEPKTVGGSLMRVYRDVRFSKDKRPYKTNVGIQFRHEKGRDVHAPGFYLHIDPDEVFLGVGIWHPDTDSLKKIRQTISKRPGEWKKAKGGKAFVDRYKLAGDSLKRPPRGFDADHPMIEDLKRKDFIAVQTLDHEVLFEPDLVKQTMASFRTAKTFMAFLCQSVKVKF